MRRRSFGTACVLAGFGLAVASLVRAPGGPLGAGTVLGYLAGSASIVAGYAILFLSTRTPPGGGDA